MNERIKQLALKAGGGLSCIAEPLEHPWKFSERELEKFAELIVRECANAFETEVDTWKEMDPYQGSIKRQGTKAIKEHFGVKE
jgi:hypothetical protein